MSVTVSQPRPLKPSLIISDLHLSDSDPKGIQWFQTFTRWLDRSVCEELFILGDLFDYWVGPKQMRISGYEPVLQSISKLVERGIPVTVLRGNRDVFLDEHFEMRTGAKVGEDVLIMEMAGKRALFMHGDLLCTRDLKYQRFRRFLRRKPIAWLAPRLPISMGLYFARGLRRYSQRVVPQKYPEEKSIVEDAVKEVLERYQADILVCGHVHERREQSISLANRIGKLIVLPAFESSQPPLIYREDFHFARLPQ